jgi:hypothetical protein
LQTTPRELSLLPEIFAICRLAPDHPAPGWADSPAADLSSVTPPAFFSSVASSVTRTTFSSVTRTAEELSVICPSGQVPAGVMADHEWRCLRLEGPFDLLEAGILAGVIGPLADAGIGAVVVATYDTDYILVRDLTAAVAALAAAGHRVTEPSGR